MGQEKMKTEEIWGHFDPIWEDLKKDSNFPQERPMLAHYTTLETVELILKNEEIWFSNPLYMNDFEELSFGVSEGTKAFFSNQETFFESCGSEARYGIFLDAFQFFMNRFNTVDAFDTYVLSLSEFKVEEPHGKLSMWRGYGGNGNGAAIIFDTSSLINNEDSPIIVSKVKYSSREDRVKWLKALMLQFSALLKTGEVSDEQLPLAAFALMQRIIIFALFTKHSGFSEEDEWRAVYMRERDSNKLLIHLLGYHVSNVGIEPKFKYRFTHVVGLAGSEVAFEKLIHRILLGPSISGVFAVSTVHRMLEKIGKKHFFGRVVASEIPYRHSR